LAGPETSHHALVTGYFQQTMNLIESFGALDRQDIVAAHWYPDGPPLADYLDALHGAAADHQLWLSQTGNATADLQARADYSPNILTIFAGTDRPCWPHVVFYRLWDGLDCCSEPIVTSTYAPNPAFNTYRAWLEQHFAIPRFPPR